MLREGMKGVLATAAARGAKLRMQATLPPRGGWRGRLLEPVAEHAVKSRAAGSERSSSTRSRILRRRHRAAHYRSQGFLILDRNFRCPLGELDLVARKNNLIVFVEVKTRRTEEHGAPETAVNYKKQRRIIRLSNYYLKQKKLWHLQPRFDVIAILWKEKASRRIKHIPAAFMDVRNHLMRETLWNAASNRRFVTFTHLKTMKAAIARRIPSAPRFHFPRATNYG